MPGPDFEPSRRTIEELLAGSDYYLIPRFQRPYRWDSSNIDEFWRDTLEDNDVGYFIGPMVGWRQNPRTPELQVVDGQQRLTTIMLILGAIRNAWRDSGNQPLADRIQRYLEKPDRDNNPRFTLQPAEAAQSYFDSILDKDFRPDRNWPDRERDATSVAFREIENRLHGALERLSAPKRAIHLRLLRDRLLGLRVIWIEHTSEDDAYVVFETLNSRGKDLEVVDLLKNHLLSKLRGGRNPRADQPRDQWSRIRSLIEESQAPIDVNRFIQHWWLSREPFVSQRKLFSTIKKAVRTQQQARQRLVDLEDDAPLYRTIFEPGYRPWNIEEGVIKQTLDALMLFGVSQPAPLLLALLRARRDRTVTLSQLKLTFTTLERFHFQFTAISRQAGSGGVSEMYARCARDISGETDRQANTARLRLIRSALVERAPDPAVFASAFVARLALTDDVNREKKLVQYVLKRMLAHSRPHTNLDGGTVEHILPQSPARRLAVANVGSIGNLLWVSDDLNGRLASKSLREKQVILQRYRALYDVEDILREPQWGEMQIEARATRLAERARAEVWRLPAARI